jgi:hypothetical protein
MSEAARCRNCLHGRAAHENSKGEPHDCEGFAGGGVFGDRCGCRVFLPDDQTEWALEVPRLIAIERVTKAMVRHVMPGVVDAAARVAIDERGQRWALVDRLYDDGRPPEHRGWVRLRALTFLAERWDEF